MKKRIKTFTIACLIFTPLFFYACEYAQILGFVQPSQVETYYANNITDSSATIQVNVLAVGALQIAEKGVCFSKTISPVIKDDRMICGTGYAPYTAKIHGLDPGKKYYVRAYTINADGVTYGNEINFITLK